MIRPLKAVAATALIAAASVLSLPADAARVGVLSNRWSAETAANFNARIPAHTFTGVDVSSSTPTLASLQASFDVVLLFEDGVFANAQTVGNVVAQFANSGRAVILGTFYDQDRSDVANTSIPLPNGWGALETLDPNTTDGIGTPTDGAGVPNAARTLNAASIVAHPLTVGVTSLTSNQFGGGNQAKPGTVVLAHWNQPNARGQPDPAIALRLTGFACVIHIGIAPDYPIVGAGQFGGDFYRVWSNAVEFGALGCPSSAPGDPAQIALGWRNRAHLDFWRSGFAFAVVLDGTPLQTGFGPALQVVTLPDGQIVARLTGLAF
jgi:hypothetical protein